MDPWAVDNIVYTRAFDVYNLESYCSIFGYKRPIVGYSFVHNKSWCRNQGKVLATLTLYGKTDKNFGIISGFKSFGNSPSEAVNKLVAETIEFILWRAEHLNRYG